MLGRILTRFLRPYWAPLLAVADPSSSSAAEAVAPLRAGNQESRDGYEALVNVAIDEGTSFRERRECIDEFGWRNFGGEFRQRR